MAEPEFTPESGETGEPRDSVGPSRTDDSARGLTRLERSIDLAAERILSREPASGARAVAIECAVFLLKQAWACVFGALLLAVIIAAKLWYPDDALLARNDALTIAAVLIQLGMLVFRLESGRELWVIVLFHLTGTAMELFKTDVGSWSYEAEGCCESVRCHCSAASCMPRWARTWFVCIAYTICVSVGTRRSG